ncbi:putative ABC-type sulfate transporter [Helianthus anomalus]
MAQLVGSEEIESFRIELSDIGRSFRSSFRRRSSSWHANSEISSVNNNDETEENLLQWAAIDRLSTFERLRSSLFDEEDGKKVVDVTKLLPLERHMFIEKLIKHIEHDNLRLLQKLRKRTDKVGVQLPSVEVRYKNLCVEAECEVVHGKPLPTLWNSLQSSLSDIVMIPGLTSNKAKITILNDVSGVIKPRRMTLLLGPPGCGKTTLLKALSGNLEKSLKAISIDGQKTTLQTNYILKILGLDICADTMFGDDMRRGISGGQKKRLTTGEMIVGPTKALYMDEISNGLDSSTTYQIITCLQQLAHITDASILISLLQPSPEAFDLFDDIMLMAEGMIVYHGPRGNVLEYFEGLGFKCPERKGVADFLQEVVSRKDQAAYWSRTEEAYNYVSVQTLSMRFKQSCLGKEIDDDISKPFTRLQNHEDAISFHVYSLSKWDLFKACMSRELLLMKRNSFVYIFKTVQLTIIAVITMTVFLRTRLKPDSVDANYYLGSLFYTLIILIVDGFPEAAMTVSRLPNFYKQRDMYFYPAWAYAIPASILKIPLSLLEAIIWTCLTYYVIGYSPEPGRFFRQLLLLFGAHFTSISLFRFLASVFQTVVSSTTAGGISILFLLTFGGFIIPHTSMPAWLKWGFWFCPLSYGEIGLAVNEFLSPRWNKMTSTNTTIGLQTLKSRGLDFDGYYYWICLGALYGFALLFNIGFILALSYFKAPGTRAIISKEKISQIHGSEGSKHQTHNNESTKNADINILETNEGKMVLPFEPLTITFQDLQYYVEPSPEMREHGFTGKRLQLLHDITGAFRPGVLTALMGVSGAGKTTLLDVLAGRKTSGIVEGEIRIGGYPKVQDTFARISGYCEQTDVHSPQITVEESVIFSAWLRLHPDIDSKTKYRFIEEIMETVELYAIKDSLVGIPGVSGLSTEQRKRLTIAVEVVANPSIIFMDEPTTGLDARSAAIVMRAVKNIVDTGRTIVCTIHQPSIDIFEAFDELILLKNGGCMIYCGPVGHNSCRVIEYFESISGVPKIRDNYNPATWMLEITSASVEAEVGVNFGQIYSTSTLYE